MKYRFVAFLCLSSLIACHKGVRTINPAMDTLIGISVDTAGVYGFTYSGGEISGITQGLPDTAGFYLGNIHYTDDEVLVYFPTVETSYQYELNAYKLPIQISWSPNNTTSIVPLAVFAYAPGTDMLDSVMMYPYNGTFTYTFQYTGQDITQVDEKFEGTPLGTFQFGYGGANNIFRASDSIFYVYAYPYTVAGEQDVIIAAFFAETFSAHTFNKLTAINSYEFGSFSSNMTYTVNQDGKITSENFVPAQYGELAAKNFYYK